MEWLLSRPTKSDGNMALVSVRSPVRLNDDFQGLSKKKSFSWLQTLHICLLGGCSLMDYSPVTKYLTSWWAKTWSPPTGGGQIFDHGVENRMISENPPISTPIRFEFNCIKTFSPNILKFHWPIFSSTEVQIDSHGAVIRIISEHSEHNKYTCDITFGPQI